MRRTPNGGPLGQSWTNTDACKRKQASPPREYFQIPTIKDGLRLTHEPFIRDTIETHANEKIDDRSKQVRPAHLRKVFHEGLWACALGGSDHSYGGTRVQIPSASLRGLTRCNTWTLLQPIPSRRTPTLPRAEEGRASATCPRNIW